MSYSDTINNLWNKFKDPERVKNLVDLIKKEVEKYGLHKIPLYL
ncbi:MAG: Hydrogenase maturation factor HypD [Thermodesulfobacterium sp.]|uniref:Hydrogenase maturation factor HypD n=1 Tax=Candidatus Thermodesulfobacterium syntrophicum TaxID=3060442 RepID=A0AAE3P4Z3_9BACT|nr:Hydrogenase maturation factor HypD [Candidatus Thermodesulfobacterium syntrophicum]